MFSIKNMLCGYIFYNLSPEYLFFLIYYFFKIKKYVISGDKELTNSLMKKITNDIFYTEVRHLNGRNQPSGFFIGKQYYGSIEIKDVTTITLYTKEDTYNLLMENDNEPKVKIKPFCSEFIITKGFKINPSIITPKTTQTIIIFFFVFIITFISL